MERKTITLEQKKNIGRDTSQDQCGNKIDLKEMTVLPVTNKTKIYENDWTFSRTIKCPELPVLHIRIPRKRVALNCKTEIPVFEISETIQPDDIFEIAHDDPCLTKFIDNCCSDGKPVPYVVHFIWFMYREFDFFNFLSFMSVVRFVRPCLILIHGDFVPYGRYWHRFTMTFPYVILVRRSPKLTIYGKRVEFIEHLSDIMRIEILKDYGGIYLDYDEVVLRSLEPLRIYNYVQGYELPNQLGSQLIMAKRNATFLQLWYDSYKNYSKEWLYNALEVPAMLASQHPELIHIDGYNFTRPSWQNMTWIFNRNYNWATNYAMHSYARMFVKEYPNRKVDLMSIRYLNTTIGSISRHVLFGSKELCYNETKSN
ncbi:hypothetical protein ACJMK2_021725 [Sinanodonta woodiana]|uniref:Glycosyltransferase n=1 Tax=Sinanodonta woodiana TaxID=1069815 RepID=A0ABD3TII7_SINWO